MAWAGFRVGVRRRCPAGCRLATVCGWPGCVWGCGAGFPAGPEAGPMCGCAVPGGCSGRVTTAAVFVGLDTAPPPAGDTRCPWIPHL